MKIKIIVLLALLTGCTTATSTDVLLANSERIIIKYNALVLSESDIKGMAADHCRKYRKAPTIYLVVKESRTYGAGETLGYECR